MSHSNGLITNPVALNSDVSAILQGSTYSNVSLGSMCMSSQINPLAKYKPVTTNQNCGFGSSIHEVGWSEYVNGFSNDLWVYYQPGSGTPYSLESFNGYKHNAWAGNTSSNTYKAFIGGSTELSVSSRTIVCNLLPSKSGTSASSYVIRTDDLYVTGRSMAGYNMSSGYFGIVAVDPNDSLHLYSLDRTFGSITSTATVTVYLSSILTIGGEWVFWPCCLSPVSGVSRNTWLTESQITSYNMLGSMPLLPYGLRNIDYGCMRGNFY